MIYDRYNVEEFKDKYNKGIYICCNCGQPTTLNDSLSHEGYHLICNRCLYKLARLLGITNADILFRIQYAGKETQKILNEKSE